MPFGDGEIDVHHVIDLAIHLSMIDPTIYFSRRGLCYIYC